MQARGPSRIFLGHGAGGELLCIVAVSNSNDFRVFNGDFGGIRNFSFFLLFKLAFISRKKLNALSFGSIQRIFFQLS